MFVNFFGAAQGFLNVVADVLFADDLGELRLVDELGWLLARAAQDQGALGGVQLGPPI